MFLACEKNTLSLPFEVITDFVKPPLENVTDKISRNFVNNCRPTPPKIAQERRPRTKTYI